MNNLDRKDMCPMAWISMRINYANLVFCCYQKSYVSFPLFEGPWVDTSTNWFNVQSLKDFRRSQIENGAKATCPIERCDIYHKIQRDGSIRNFLTR